MKISTLTLVAAIAVSTLVGGACSALEDVQISNQSKQAVGIASFVHPDKQEYGIGLLSAETGWQFKGWRVVRPGESVTLPEGFHHVCDNERQAIKWNQCDTVKGFVLYGQNFASPLRINDSSYQEDSNRHGQLAYARVDFQYFTVGMYTITADQKTAYHSWQSTPEHNTAASLIAKQYRVGTRMDEWYDVSSKLPNIFSSRTGQDDIKFREFPLASIQFKKLELTRLVTTELVSD